MFQSTPLPIHERTFECGSHFRWNHVDNISLFTHKLDVVSFDVASQISCVVEAAAKWRNMLKISFYMSSHHVYWLTPTVSTLVHDENRIWNSSILQQSTYKAFYVAIIYILLVKINLIIITITLVVII